MRTCVSTMVNGDTSVETSNHSSRRPPAASTPIPRSRRAFTLVITIVLSSPSQGTASIIWGQWGRAAGRHGRLSPTTNLHPRTNDTSTIISDATLSRDIARRDRIVSAASSFYPLRLLVDFILRRWAFGVSCDGSAAQNSRILFMETIK